jgi:hypothetical protein
MKKLLLSLALVFAASYSHAGIIFVPPPPTPYGTPTPAPTATVQPSPTAMNTPTPAPTATPAPTDAPTPTAVNTATPAPTATVQPSPTAITSTSSNFNFNSTTPYWTEFSNGNSGAAKTVDWTANGGIQSVTINGNCTFTFTAPPGPSRLQLRMVHDATANTYTLTWPAAVKWPGGVAGANTNTNAAVDLLVCYYDGTNYNCTLTVAFS